MDEEEDGGRRSTTAPGADAEGDVPGVGRHDPLLELNEVFSALGHPRRRYVMYTLVTESSSATLDQLATKLVAWERRKPTEAVTDEERHRMTASLHHAHVPKLADLGVVEYDADDRVVSRTTNAAQVRAVLDGAGAELDQRQETHARETKDVGADDERLE